MSVEPAPDCADPAGVRSELERTFRRVYNLRVPIELVASGTLPRFDLKARRWVDA